MLDKKRKMVYASLQEKKVGALAKEEPYYTYADYKEWELDEGERYELINGEAYAMSAPNLKHQAISMELSSQFHTYLRGKPCKVYAAPVDVRLFYRSDENDDTVLQPDLIIICDEEKRGPEGCRGAPDLVVEILSPSNTAIEMDQKLKLYQKAGVREYWVIDPENKGLTIYCFEKDVVALKIYKNTGKVKVAILPGLRISLEQVFAE